MKNVNEELRIANEALAANAAQRSQDGAMNIRALQVMQDMLESMPFAVLGIGDDGIIAIANGKACEFLDHAGFGLLGGLIQEVLPGAIAGCCAARAGGNRPVHETVSIDGKAYEVWVTGMGRSSLASGSILLMLPRG